MKKYSSLTIFSLAFCLTLSSYPFSANAQVATGEKYMTASVTSPVNNETVESSGSIDAVAPLAWIRVQAIRAGKTVTVRWTTFTEVNVKGFVIERSFNGRDWDVVATNVKAYSLPGLSCYEQTFAGKKFKKASYRLRQEDFDGSYGYSPIVKAARNKN